jgi:hypothetical protein
MRFPLAWRVMGKQMFVVGRRVESDDTARHAPAAQARSFRT